MNFFKGKMALKMGGWEFISPSQRGNDAFEACIKLFFGRPYCKGSWQILLSTVCFSREISLRFLQRGQATVDLLGYKKKTTLQLGPYP